MRLRPNFTSRQPIVKPRNMKCLSPPRILLTSLALFLLGQSIELFSYRRNEASEIPLERLARANGDLKSRPRNKNSKGIKIDSERNSCSILIPVAGLLVC